MKLPALTLALLLVSGTLSRSAAAQQSLGTSPDDSCASLQLPLGVDEEQAARIGRALGICEDLKRLYATGERASERLNLLQEQEANENSPSTGDLDRLLQQGDQNGVLRELGRELQQSREERDRLTSELQQRLLVERTNAKIAALAADSNSARLAVQSALVVQHSFLDETEFRRYQHTKFLNAFLGTTISTVGTGLQLNSSAHVQQAGDVLGVVGGAVTAVLNICTADWNVKDQNDDGDAPSKLLKAFPDQNRSDVLPPDVWDSLDQATKDAIDKIFSLNKGHTDLPLLHLSCHWGSGLNYKADAGEIKSVDALHRLDEALARINSTATALLEQNAQR
jgi:hypothetical protein